MTQVLGAPRAQSCCLEEGGVALQDTIQRAGMGLGMCEILSLPLTYVPPGLNPETHTARLLLWA